ncbi:MAG TPA: LysM peptidoglycan-binding domain-containing protein [Puia sp.]|nr:LysM peptidoglycan-binding domain-containing protein [Puia sp.]
MKNRIVFFVLFIFYAFKGHSQHVQLHIEGTNGKFYLVHMVVAKENWYSIGRLFNLSPHDIASFNNMSFDKPLEVATQLNIPLNASNFDQKQLKIPGETLVPIYHMVEEKEWMFKLSSVYNDVPVTSLEKWNNIKRDDLRAGTDLIVGFLRVKTDLSPLASGISSNPSILPSTSDSGNKTGKQTEVVASTTVSAPLYRAEPAKTTVTAVSNTTTGTSTVSNTNEKINNYALSHSNGGFFSSDYTTSGKNTSGQAGTFKSTSGWSDGKYYALMNGVPVGTIIRVSGANGKTIYAKVLGQLPDMKESAGLITRISNAASAELGLGEGRFPVEIKY